jgi:hypothetical protein
MRTCAVALGVALASLPGAAAPPRPLVMVLAGAPAPEAGVSLESFLFALSLQLDPYGIDVREEAVRLGSTLPAQLELARERGQRAGAVAVVWYTGGRAEGRSVVVHIVDLRRRRTLVQMLTLGAPTAGIERSMAVAVRTLLRAAPLELEPASRAAPASTPAASDARRPATAASRPRAARQLLDVGAGYALEAYPIGRDLRHGPDLSVAVRRWRRFEGRLVVGYRLAREGRDAEREWARSLWRLSFTASLRLRLGQRGELTVGPRLGLAVIDAEARALAAPRSERARLWELSLGVAAGARLALARRFALGLGATVAGLPLRSALVVGGEEVARSGALELALAGSVHVGFF